MSKFKVFALLVFAGSLCCIQKASAAPERPAIAYLARFLFNIGYKFIPASFHVLQDPSAGQDPNFFDTFDADNEDFNTEATETTEPPQVTEIQPKMLIPFIGNDSYNAEDPGED